jgi:CRISPR/Cas system CMR-associated protein Cmr5 small subunit
MKKLLEYIGRCRNKKTEIDDPNYKIIPIVFENSMITKYTIRYKEKYLYYREWLPNIFFPEGHVDLKYFRSKPSKTDGFYTYENRKDALKIIKQHKNYVIIHEGNDYYAE